jgi:uncharacterized protein with NRDE domain
MCTLALYFQIFEHFPLVVAANRDEHYDRPSLPPGFISGSPAIFGGKDLRVGGTWLAVNQYSVLSAILNRRLEPGEAPTNEVRSRGLLCLDMLNFENAADAEASLPNQKQYLYQPFNLVVADPNHAWAAFNVTGEIHAMPLAPGLHVFSSNARHDERSEKKERAYARFAGLLPELSASDVASWIASFQQALADHSGSNGSPDRREAICVHGDVSGTVSSSIIMYSRPERRFRTFFSDGPPCQHAFSESASLNIDDSRTEA